MVVLVQLTNFVSLCYLVLLVVSVVMFVLLFCCCVLFVIFEIVESCLCVGVFVLNC